MTHMIILHNEKRNSLSSRILATIIPMSVTKPLKFGDYEGIGDLDEHVKHIDNRLGYYHAHRVNKCKLFALTLIKDALKWYWMEALTRGRIIVTPSPPSLSPKMSTYNCGGAQQDRT